MDMKGVNERGWGNKFAYALLLHVFLASLLIFMEGNKIAHYM